ncbi:MAG TPA: carboxylesterase family protein [Mobilitalea sp.]|nr:carboxylesterase family protein [Mobilitalea sp.]
MEKYIVETTSGKVRGYERNGLIEYLGIPYAQPPLGKLRFKRARPISQWKGIFGAKEYGHVSVQLEEGELKGDEDCLTLNIQRPLEGENFPVLVWIHGGGYNTGSASDPLYNGKAFVEDGILFISFQYRLNVLGFYDFTTYPGCEDFESNCGISDHIIAMKWIHENVKVFGGNPNQVTIAGESAGGTSIMNMLVIPSVRGMFQQAIPASAIPNGIFTHEIARENMDLFLEGMKWTDKDLPKLRTIHPFELQKGNTYVAEKHQYRNPGMFLPSPVLDDLIPVRPLDAIRNGSAAGIKLMIGTNLHEGTMFVRSEKTVFPSNWSMVEEMFKKNGNEEALPAIMEYYQSGGHEDFNGIDEAFIQFATDYAFQMPALKIAEAQKAYGEVWMYRFEFISKFGQKTGYKAAHAFELPCVFKNRNFKFSRLIFDDEPEEKVEAIINSIHTSWVQFIKTGKPDAENWPKYTGYDSPIRIFDEKTRTEQLNRSELMSVWGDLRFYEDSTSSS